MSAEDRSFFPSAEDARKDIVDNYFPDLTEIGETELRLKHKDAKGADLEDLVRIVRPNMHFRDIRDGREYLVFFPELFASLREQLMILLQSFVKVHTKELWGSLEDAEAGNDAAFVEHVVPRSSLFWGKENENSIKARILAAICRNLDICLKEKRQFVAFILDVNAGL